MNIIIPMTGYGSRFVAAGYKDLKPLIPVQGKCILQWILEGMYPDETDITFICRAEHLDSNPGMEALLRTIAPTAKVIPIRNWVKKGPVFDVLRAAESINDTKPCIINYCDFYMTWDWKGFKQKVLDMGVDGAIPCYSGFHPHLLKKNNIYASCLTDQKDLLLEIREKFSFETDKTKAKHSPGVYYFRTGALLKKYCQKLVDYGPALNNEYYASLPYNYMVQDGLKVWVPVNVEHFCQWGTPEDLNEYLFWTEHVRRFQS